MQKNHPRSSLSIVMKVSILAASVTAIASVIVGSVIINGSSDIIFQDALNRLKYETNIKSINLVTDIKNLRGDAQYLVGTPPIKGIPRAIENDGTDPIGKSDLIEWESRLETIFSELIRAKPNYLQIRYIGITGEGKELIRVDRQGSSIQKVDSKNLQQKGNMTYFKEAIKLHPGEVHLSNITLNREFGKISEPHTSVIRAATPVFYNKKLFAVLVINMEFNQIFKQLIKNTPREFIPYVTNEEGYFLAHPNKKMTYGFDLGNNNKIQTRYKDFNLMNNSDLRDDAFTVRTNGDVIHVIKSYYDPRNEERYFAVMLATSNKNLKSKSEELRLQSFLIMGFLVIISLITAALLASKLMRPLQLISTASEDLAHGREVSNLPIESNDEIGELARSFDNMRHQLEDKENELLISQSHVHQANKMASLGEMASGMAHEINSPIQTISLTAQRVQRQLSKDMPKEDINSSMENIVKSVNNISEIIDSLRRVSRASNDDNFIDTTIKDIIDDVKHMTVERFKVKSIRFDVHYNNMPDTTTIQCQRLQISQVLINLVNNAYDAIHELDDKWIKISVNKITDKIQISVTDSGSSITDDIVDRIFEPLFTTKEIGKGTGLGLSISRDIILKHNGLFFIDKESKNTRFIIELPIFHVKK